MQHAPLASVQALATAVPRQRLTQSEAWTQFAPTPQAAALSKRARAVVRAVLTRDNGIHARHLAIEPALATLNMGPQALNEAFERHAPALAQQALSSACAQAEILPSALDGVVVCTCTGYICPGVSSHVAEKLGVRPNAHLSDMVGLGCGAALPALRSGAAMVGSGARHVAVIAVEVCSAAFYLSEDPGVLVSACLFGDGAAAAILTPATTAARLGQLGPIDSLHQPQHRGSLRFVNENGYLANRLARAVPTIAATAVGELFATAHKRDRTPPDVILAHPGGQDVLAAIRARIPQYPLAESEGVLRAYGNMSSPSVLFALRQWLDTAPTGGSSAWLTAFGAGFSAHAGCFEAS